MIDHARRVLGSRWPVRLMRSATSTTITPHGSAAPPTKRLLRAVSPSPDTHTSDQQAKTMPTSAMAHASGSRRNVGADSGAGTSRRRPKSKRSPAASCPPEWLAFRPLIYPINNLASTRGCIDPTPFAPAVGCRSSPTMVPPPTSTDGSGGSPDGSAPVLILVCLMAVAFTKPRYPRAGNPGYRGAKPRSSRRCLIDSTTPGAVDRIRLPGEGADHGRVEDGEHEHGVYEGSAASQGKSLALTSLACFLASGQPRADVLAPHLGACSGRPYPEQPQGDPRRCGGLRAHRSRPHPRRHPHPGRDRRPGRAGPGGRDLLC